MRRRRGRAEAAGWRPRTSIASLLLLRVELLQIRKTKAEPGIPTTRRGCSCLHSKERHHPHKGWGSRGGHRGPAGGTAGASRPHDGCGTWVAFLGVQGLCAAYFT